MARHFAILAYAAVVISVAAIASYKEWQTPPRVFENGHGPDPDTLEYKSAYKSLAADKPNDAVKIGAFWLVSGAAIGLVIFRRRAL
jgi:hypothetical protein